MRLTDILAPGRIKVSLAGDTKERVIEELVDLLVAEGAVSDRDRVLQAVLERESTRTTGIGYGLALPHGKSTAVGQLAMAVGTCPAGVDFQSIDEKPVVLVMLVVSPPDATSSHIQALARISRLMSISVLRQRVASAATSEEIFAAIREQETKEQTPAGTS